MKRLTEQRWLVALVAFGLVGFFAGCDSLTSPAADDSQLAVEAPELAAMADVLTQELSLTSVQRGDVENVLFHHRDRRHEPGFMWTVARDLQTTLTAEQKERLRARAAEVEARGGFFSPGLGLGFGPGGMGPGLFNGGPFGNGGFGPGMHGAGMQAGGTYGPGMHNGGMRGPGSGDRAGFGHGWGDGAWGPADGTGSLLEEVLDEEQLAILSEIRSDFRSRVDELLEQHRDGVVTHDAFRAAWIELREAMQAEIADRIVLTEEQEAELDRLREERRDAHRAEMEAYRAETRTAMREALGLTDEQIDQLDALIDRLRDDVDALADGDAAALALLQQQFRADVEALLDDTQLEIYDIYHALQLLRPMHGGWSDGVGPGGMGAGGRWGGSGGRMHGGQNGGPGGGMGGMGGPR